MDSLLELTDLAGGREKTRVKRLGYGAGGIREGGGEAGDDVAGACGMTIPTSRSRPRMALSRVVRVASQAERSR